MDLNELLTRHQTSLIRAEGAACVPSRRAHVGLARGYGTRIRALQLGSGALAPLAEARP